MLRPETSLARDETTLEASLRTEVTELRMPWPLTLVLVEEDESVVVVD